MWCYTWSGVNLNVILSHLITLKTLKSQKTILALSPESLLQKGSMQKDTLEWLHYLLHIFFLTNFEYCFDKVCSLKTSWNWFMKSLCHFSDWMFVFSFSANSCFTQVVAVLGQEQRCIDMVSAFHFSTYIVRELAIRVHSNLNSICKHYKKCCQGALTRNRFRYI